MKAAVLGSPIAHSKSPALHQAAYRALGLDWTYERYEVGSGALQRFLADREGEFAGVSLTMPLKDEAFELADVRDDASLATLASNTLVFRDRRYGYNTDVTGFIEALRYRGIAQPDSVTILGTGATARSAAFAMHSIGVGTITVAGRRPAALDAFLAWFATCGGIATSVAWEAVPEVTDLTISTTTAGATDERALPPNCTTLFDVIYAPWPTEYAARWVRAGGTVLGGLDLLVHQAAEQVLLMTGVATELRPRIVEAMYAAVVAPGA